MNAQVAGLVGTPAPAPALASTTASSIKASLSPAGSKIRHAARQFEAQLLTSVLAAMEKSFGSVPGGEDEGAGAQYRSLATESLASAWAEAGGVGLAGILEGALQKAAGKTVVPPAGLPPEVWRPVQALRP